MRGCDFRGLDHFFTGWIVHDAVIFLLGLRRWPRSLFNLSLVCERCRRHLPDWQAGIATAASRSLPRMWPILDSEITPPRPLPLRPKGLGAHTGVF
jgi:hypothetical protein